MIRKQIEAMVQTFLKFYETSNEQLTPTCALFDRDGALSTIVEMPMANEEDKQRGILALCMAMVTTESFGYIFSSEAWLKTTTADEVRDGIKVMPRDSEDRQEVLILEGHSFVEDEILIYDIVRDWTTGKVTDLRLKEDMAGTEMYSRFNIFPPREKGTKH